MHTVEQSTNPQQHLAVVYNPTKEGLAQLRETVSSVSTKAGWAAPKWYETDEADGGSAATSKAVSDGAAAVLAVGGDGTVRAVAVGLKGTTVPLAIVPLGTGNVLARNLGIPLDDQVQQVEAAVLGQRQQMDLATATVTRPDGSTESAEFLVLAGMGMDARTIAKTDSKLKKSIGWLAYVSAGLKELLRDKKLKLRVQIDTRPQQKISAYTLMVGNCGYMPGGAHLIPDAVIDDGALDVVALVPQGGLRGLSWLRIARKILLKNSLLRGTGLDSKVSDSNSVRYRTVRRIVLEVAHPEPVQLDGEDFGTALRFVAEVNEEALIVCVNSAWEAPTNAFSRSGRPVEPGTAG